MPIWTPQKPTQDLLVNGNMEVWQRGVGPFTASLVYGPDKWLNGIIAGGSTMSISPDAGNAPPGTTLACKAIITIGTQPVILLQRISNTDDLLQMLAGQTVTWAMWAKTTVPNGTRLILDQNGTDIAFSPYCPSDGAYHLLKVTGVVPSSPGSFFDMRISYEVSGTYYHGAGTLAVGPIAMDYTPKPVALAVAIAQRNYEIIGEPNSGKFMVGGNYAPTGLQLFTSVVFKANKVVVPTVTVVGAWTGGTSGVVGPSINGQDRYGCLLYCVSGATGLAYISNLGAGCCITVEANA